MRKNTVTRHVTQVVCSRKALSPLEASELRCLVLSLATPCNFSRFAGDAGSSGVNDVIHTFNSSSTPLIGSIVGHSTNDSCTNLNTIAVYSTSGRYEAIEEYPSLGDLIPAGDVVLQCLVRNDEGTGDKDCDFLFIIVTRIALDRPRTFQSRSDIIRTSLSLSLDFFCSDPRKLASFRVFSLRCGGVLIISNFDFDETSNSNCTVSDKSYILSSPCDEGSLISSSSLFKSLSGGKLLSLFNKFSHLCQLNDPRLRISDEFTELRSFDFNVFDSIAYILRTHPSVKSSR
mmetsp:Transcript_16384/g.24698  ORF Transcript_16384/g.24698 Transcript_16384/m.24698 type:complete len:288 (-) Transcript_16384:3032-3895(-)